jgi:hypothetical protein
MWPVDALVLVLHPVLRLCIHAQPHTQTLLVLVLQPFLKLCIHAQPHIHRHSLVLVLHPVLIPLLDGQGVVDANGVDVSDLITRQLKLHT